MCLGKLLVAPFQCLEMLDTSPLIAPFQPFGACCFEIQPGSSGYSGHLQGPWCPLHGLANLHVLGARLMWKRNLLKGYQEAKNAKKIP